LFAFDELNSSATPKMITQSNAAPNNPK